MKLSDSAVKALKPKPKRYLKSDGRGLYIDVMRGGVKSWIFRYTLNGKAGKVFIGRYPELSLADARLRRAEQATLVEQGKRPSRARKLGTHQNSLNPTVREFGERYYDEQVTQRRKNPKDIRRYLDNEIYPSMGDRFLKDVNALDVQGIVYRKRDNGRVAAAMQLRNVMKGMFDYALEVQLVTINPAAMVATRYIGKARKRSRVLKPNEIRLYLRTIYQSNIRRQFKLALHVILLTLTRKSELLLAKWDHVNFETGEWLIPEENAKNGKPHIIYMPDQVATMFRELKVLAGGSVMVLPGRGSLSSPFAKNALNKALEGLTFDMEPLTIHDLRRTGSTLLRENGFPRDVVEKALNHVPKGIEGVYNLAEHAVERKRMLQWWADYVDILLTETNVILGRFGTA